MYWLFFWFFFKCIGNNVSSINDNKHIKNNDKLAKDIDDDL